MARRTRQINVRFSAEELRMLRWLSARKALSIASFLRMTLKEHHDALVADGLLNKDVRPPVSRGGLRP
jgi:hypothetical protein